MMIKKMMIESKIEFKERFSLEWEEQRSLWNVFRTTYHYRDGRTAAEKKMTEKFEMCIKEMNTKIQNLKCVSKK